ncbi:MAG: hypothetical protein A2W90_18080 [Bacteroidetes bacterium GWF2_42_66]|nr:MAG: hypothetical protein A2W92_06070 [Bacteroidetes bacterium GWA2_42_15]OFX98161.1 MAG: hypothetical protein A2W89_09570 [Bacteroidetes bacterium GWE2_42_39]OFY42546.1 MAG: hypothetical protein A2W90_18080 [Bacteroidetes bacterium GWF2_42_66]HBL74262.1 hypothetical protein [Prolixibacteraceae bacterium]HCU64031.1 hypothetical protein [Prolixibacteraceae bacterium]
MKTLITILFIAFSLQCFAIEKDSIRTGDIWCSRGTSALGVVSRAYSGVFELPWLGKLPFTAKTYSHCGTFIWLEGELYITETSSTLAGIRAIRYEDWKYRDSDRITILRYENINHDKVVLSFLELEGAAYYWGNYSAHALYIPTRLWLGRKWNRTRWNCSAYVAYCLDLERWWKETPTSLACKKGMEVVK